MDTVLKLVDELSVYELKNLSNYVEKKIETDYPVNKCKYCDKKYNPNCDNDDAACQYTCPHGSKCGAFAEIHPALSTVKCVTCGCRYCEDHCRVVVELDWKCQKCYYSNCYYSN